MILIRSMACTEIKQTSSSFLLPVRTHRDMLRELVISSTWTAAIDDATEGVLTPDAKDER